MTFLLLHDNKTNMGNQWELSQNSERSKGDSEIEGELAQISQQSRGHYRKIWKNPQAAHQQRAESKPQSAKKQRTLHVPNVPGSREIRRAKETVVFEAHPLKA